MKEPSKKTFADVGKNLWQCDPEMFSVIVAHLKEDEEATK